MNKALLDTDIYSEVLKSINQTVTRNATAYRLAMGHLTFSVNTVMEIIQIFRKVGASSKRVQAFRIAIRPEEILSFNHDAADLAGLIAGDLDRGRQVTPKKMSVKKNLAREKSKDPGKERVRATGAQRKDSQSGMIRARVSPSLKAEVDGILAELGLNSSEAVRLFYAQVALRKGLPFRVNIPNGTTWKALRDAEAGLNMTDYTSVNKMFKDLDM